MWSLFSTEMRFNISKCNKWNNSLLIFASIFWPLLKECYSDLSTFQNNRVISLPYQICIYYIYTPVCTDWNRYQSYQVFPRFLIYHCAKSEVSLEVSTKYLFVFSPNVGKYGPEKTPYLDNFQILYGYG